MPNKREQDPGYDQWLKDTDGKDTKLNREWYDCPDDERSDFLKEHKDWFKRR